MYVCMCAQLFVTPWNVAHQTPLSMEFSRQEYLSGLSFPHPRDLPYPGIKFLSLVSPALAGRFLSTEPPGISRRMLLVFKCRLFKCQCPYLNIIHWDLYMQWNHFWNHLLKWFLEEIMFMVG